MNQPTPTRANVVVLKQILNLIPLGMINRHARETGVEAKARTFSVLSHLSAMLLAQLSHAIGRNDVCDWLRLAVLDARGVQWVTRAKDKMQYRVIKNIARVAPPIGGGGADPVFCQRASGVARG